MNSAEPPKVLYRLKTAGLFDRDKQCTKKKTYDTEIKALRFLNNFYASKINEFNVYECPHCFCWHVGHKIKEMP